MSSPRSTDTSLHQHAVPTGANVGERNGSAPPAERSDLPASRSAACKTGAERVLALARERGHRGVHQTDFDAGQVIDGGRPIRRLAARIDDLKNEGHWFDVRRNRDRTTTYILIRDAATVNLALREASGPEPPQQLFDPPPAPLNAALHDWDSDAA